MEYSDRVIKHHLTYDKKAFEAYEGVEIDYLCLDIRVRLMEMYVSLAKEAMKQATINNFTAKRTSKPEAIAPPYVIHCKHSSHPPHRQHRQPPRQSPPTGPSITSNWRSSIDEDLCEPPPSDDVSEEIVSDLPLSTGSWGGRSLGGW